MFTMKKLQLTFNISQFLSNIIKIYILYRIVIWEKVKVLKGKVVVKDLVPRRVGNKIFQGIFFHIIINKICINVC